MAIWDWRRSRERIREEDGELRAIKTAVEDTLTIWERSGKQKLAKQLRASLRSLLRRDDWPE